jgi:hypothetical protein
MDNNLNLIEIVYLLHLYNVEQKRCDNKGKLTDEFLEEIKSELKTRNLEECAKDEDEFIRCAVARNIDVSYLPNMMNDEHWSVRLCVARKIDKKYLKEMLENEAVYNDNLDNIIHASYIQMAISARDKELAVLAWANSELECVGDFIKDEMVLGDLGGK